MKTPRPTVITKSTSRAAATCPIKAIAAISATSPVVNLPFARLRIPTGKLMGVTIAAMNATPVELSQLSKFTSPKLTQLFMARKILSLKTVMQFIWMGAIGLPLMAFAFGCGGRKSEHARETMDSIEVSEEISSPVERNDQLKSLKKSKKKPEENYTIVRTFFATDRDQNTNTNAIASQTFGSARSTLKYGTCEVSIPRDHRLGELEAPSIWRLEFKENPDKHVVLLTTRSMRQDFFFDSLRQRIQSSSSSSAFIFVHGYNVSFEDAARRTAQITYDLSFDGAPVFYSWPSQGKTAAYTVDEQTIEWAQGNLLKFLKDFFDQSDAQNVYLIAHSMGNRALTRSLAALLTEKPEVRKRLTEVVLTAPDIDAEVFKRDIAPALTRHGRPITLYASSRDLALQASKQVHGYARAGDSGPEMVIMPGIETIDATKVETGFLGHSYFAENKSVLSDIFYLIKEGQRADRRFGLREVNTARGRYWAFKD